jgi:secretion/DNA translocation related CpaE-like protein
MQRRQGRRREPGAEDRPPVVLVTGSATLLEQVHQLAAAVDVPVVDVSTGGEARHWWSRAALLLVGHDTATALPVAPTRRDGVVVLTEQPHEQETAWRHAVGLGAEHVAVLPEESAWLIDRLGDAVEGHREAPVVGLVGCRGGVGASTLLAALALVAGRSGLATVVADLDPLGADLDLLLDTADEPGLRWSDLAQSRGRLPAGSLAAALPQRGAVSILSAGPGSSVPVAPDAVDAVLPALARVHDLVLLDLPRWPDGAAAPALRRCSTLLLVTTADPRGAAALHRFVERLGSEPADVRLVARVGRTAVVDPEDVAAGVRLPLLTRIPTDSRLASGGDLDRAVARGAVGRACRSVLAGLAATRARSS